MSIQNITLANGSTMYLFSSCSDYSDCSNDSYRQSLRVTKSYYKENKTKKFH